MTSPIVKPARKRKAKASQADRCGGTREEEKQATKPDIDSAALHRRAKELSTEIQRGNIVENSQEKVDRIKAEIKNGTYRIDADAIADKLMEYDFQLEDDQQK